MISDDISDILLDKNGDIDAAKLSKSLQEALSADLRYKQRDNMKKRACKAATNYDEFKAMVDCAHLKTLNKQDIESLKAVKRGWQYKQKEISGSQGTSILIQEEKQSVKNYSQDKIINKKLNLKQTFSMPRTPLELGRDFNRLASNADRMRYLREVGIERMVKLLNVDCDAELFESILRTLLSSQVILQEMTPTSQESSNDILNLCSDDSVPYSFPVSSTQWIASLSQLKKYSLLYDFLDESIKLALKEHSIAPA